MTLFTCGILGIGLLLLFLAIGMPVGIAMLASGFIGMVLAGGFNVGLNMMQLVPFSTTANYTMVVLPLFLIMGEFAFHGQLSEDGYYFMHRLFGHLRGGMAMATVGGCAAFAAVCGSSLATAVTMGTVALPEMRRYKTDNSLATGVLAAGGTIGILIPPSIGFIIYAIVTEQSIGQLFIAGFFPGILMSILFMITISILCQLNPSLSPAAPRASPKEVLKAGGRGWGIVVLFLLVIGGIYLGVFTPIEGAGIGATGAFLLALFKRRLTWQNFWVAILSAGKTTGMLFVIVIGAFTFGYFLTITRVPFAVSAFVAGLQVSPYVILVLICIFYLLLGCLMDIPAGMLITLPIIYPVIKNLGFDPIWFGVIVVILMEMGLITPPVGLNVYAISGIARDIPMATIFRGIVPFLGAMAVCLLLIILFPQIALFLPNMLR
jgi:C4-dicarboxylate transporter DctM subunit